METESKKRKYVKPRCEVYELPQRTALLAGSGGTEDYQRPGSPYNW